MPHGRERGWQQVAARFDRRAESYERESLWVQDEAVIDIVLGDLEPGSQVLDVGAGTGVLSAEATTRGSFPICVDISEAMLRLARGKGLLSVCADLHRLPFADKSVDVVIERQALQYANVPVALREFRRVARREIRIGQIVAADEESRRLWCEMFSLLGQPPRKVFVKGELEELVAASELKITRRTGYVGTERLVTPNRGHPESSFDATAIMDRLARIDPSAKAHDDDWVHSVEWEFITAELS